jgi:hypothetical protein
MWPKKEKDELKRPDVEDSLAVRQKDPDFIQLSTLQLAKILLVDKFLKRKPDTYVFDHGDRGTLVKEPPPEPPAGEKIYHLAIVLNDQVKDVLRTNERLAELLTKNIEFIAFDPEVDDVRIHSMYEDGEFITNNFDQQDTLPFDDEISEEPKED